MQRHEILQFFNHTITIQPTNQSIKFHTREESSSSSRHTRHWSTLLSTQRQNRRDRVLRQLESHSKECVESLDRFLIGPNHHHHHHHHHHHQVQTIITKTLVSESIIINSNDLSTLVLSNVQDCCSIQYPIINPIPNHQSNPIESVVMIHPSMRASEQASARANLEEKSRLVPSLESRSSPSSTFFDDDTHSIRPFQQPIQATVPATTQLPATTARSTAIEDLGSSHRACSTRSRSIGWSVSARAPSRRQTPSHSISLDILESILRV